VRPLLLTLADWLAIFIDRNAQALQERFVFPKPQPGIIHRLCDKWQMFLLAREHRIATPETCFAANLSEALAFAGEAGFPLMMKGADPLRPNVSSKSIIRDAAELRDAYTAAPQPPNAILQQYIPGTAADVWMCNAYFGSQSRCKAILTGRKLRQVSSTGVASLGACEPNDAVAQMTVRFMQAVGYEGVLDVGYRYDSRDGKYKVLDVNPRVGGAFRLFRATNGLDVVRAAYLDLTGQPVPESRLSVGRKWMLEDDFFAARAEGLSFVAWLRSIRGVRETQWFAADDLVPGLAWASWYVRDILGRRLRRA
jgi:predicted ATP-grasp superfamily ATP-dependent carboligase